MQISSFKLIDEGYTGIRVTAKEAIPQGNLTIIDEVTRTRLYPLSDEAIKSVQKLKYFFLNLTGHWIEVFNKSFNSQTYEIIHPEPGTEPAKSYILLQSLLSHTKITGISLKNAGFCITGTIETVEGKKMGVTTPFVTEEDDLGFFLEATSKINSIIDGIAGILNSPKAVVFNAREVIEHKGLKKDHVDEMKADEMIDLVVNRLNDLGIVVLQNEPLGLEEKKKDKVNTNTKSIDSHNVEEVQLHEETSTTTEADQIIIKDKKDFGKGSLASEKKFPRVGDDGKEKPGIIPDNIPEGGSLEHLEYSENLGMQRDDQVKGAGLEEDLSGDAKTEW
jgi:hypothetical protein